VVGVREFARRFGRTRFPVDSFFRIISVAGDQRLRGYAPAGSREASARRPQNFSEAHFAGIGFDFCKVCLADFYFSRHGVDVFPPTLSFQVKLGMLVPTAAHLAHPSPAEIATWGQTSDTPAVAKLAGLIDAALDIRRQAASKIPNH